MEQNGLQLMLTEDASPEIHASGELNYLNCDELGNLLHEASGSDGRKIRLSLGGLDFADSSGLRVLVTAAYNARLNGGSVAIVSMTPQLEHVLQITGCRHLFDIEATCKIPVTARMPRPPDARFYSFETEANLAACRDIRNSVCDFAASLGADAEVLDDLRLAVGEAVSNAVRHGCCDGKAVSVRCCVEADRFCVTLRYPSARFDPNGVPSPDLEMPREGGMGIHFMRLVMDRVHYEFEDECVILGLEKRLSRSADAGGE